MPAPLDDAYPLSDAAIRGFRADGHVRVDALASAGEIAAYRPAIVEAGSVEPESYAPGDATSHAGWTLHRAPPNRRARMREVMTISYYADGTRVGPLDHPNRRFDRDVWLAGCEPGELAAGPKNPVLWRRAA